MFSFDDTQVAFSDKTNRQLNKIYWLFWLVKSPLLVKIGSVLLKIANTIRIPLNWALKTTVFEHFCGGENLQECEISINQLADYNIKAVLDFAAEGINNEDEFDEATERIISTIELARINEGIAFAVFKPTAIARFGLLERITAQHVLTKEEQKEYERVKSRAIRICDAAKSAGIPVMVDAEETWIQDAADLLVEELMKTYNTKNPVVFHTLQMYRVDKLFYLKNLMARAKEEHYIPGFKLVRGAYMEMERKRAIKKQYASPIHPDKNATNNAFNDAMKFCLSNLHHSALFIGTHNEESCIDAVNIMEINNIPRNHERVYFSQLKGMSDHISYKLAREGYNVCKYLPYGPIRLVLPYLIRRAQENTSVAGQTSRELFLIKQELKRRKKG